MDTFVLIILIIVCVMIGFVLDNLLHLLRDARNTSEKTGATVPEKPNTDDLVRNEQDSLPEHQPEPPSPPVHGLVGVLHMWRDPHSQQIIIEAGGKRFYSPSGLEKEHLELLTIVRDELNTWLEQPTESFTPGMLPVETTVSAEKPSRKSQRFSLNPIDLISNALQAEIRKPASEINKSLAAQVDEVLQEKIQGTPLAKRGVRIMDAPDQGLWVQVGMDKYAGLEEVPDNEIKEIIRESVAEWRRRTYPGR